MGNRYITVRDPDGRFWHIVIGAIIGGTINVITHSSKIHSWQDGLVAFGIGAAAGALGAATGGAAAAAFELSATTFMGGMVSGAVGGAYGKLAEGTGNAIYFGDQFKMSDVLTATVQGAALGGALGTIAGRIGGKTGMDLMGQPKISGKTISLSLSSGGKTIDPMYSNQPRLAGAGGLGEGGSYTMPEYAEGNFYKPATTYNRDGSIVFATSSEGAGGELGNIKVNINLNPELATANGGIQLTKKIFGHTFTTHGDDMTNFLLNRARGSGIAQGQFLNNQEAAKFILDNVGKTANGAVTIPIPKGFPARVIMPDGTFEAATHIRLVPGGGGVKTAYPLIP